MAFKMNARSPLMKTLVGAQKNLPEGLKGAIEAAPESPAKIAPLVAMAGKAIVGSLASKAANKVADKIDPESPAKNMNKGYGTPSPAKMNKGERYDMKMASDQNLKASARKNYAENAEAAQKSSPAKKDIGPEKAKAKAKVKVTGSNVPGASGQVKKYTNPATKLPLKTSTFKDIPLVASPAKKDIGPEKTKKAQTNPAKVKRSMEQRARAKAKVESAISKPIAKKATKTLVKTRIKETMVPGLKVKPIKKISVTKTVKRR